MVDARVKLEEETLDPQDWDAMRALGHQMVDEMMDYLATVRDRPAWQPPSDTSKQLLSEPVPHEAVGAEQAYEEFKTHVLPYPMGNIHPRFWGWVMGTGTPLGMLADMLAAGINPNLGGFNQAPALVEHQVIAWMAELLGMPGASGIVVNGGTMASTVGLAVARFAKSRELGFDSRADGLQS